MDPTYDELSDYAERSREAHERTFQFVRELMRTFSPWKRLKPRLWGEAEQLLDALDQVRRTAPSPVSPMVRGDGGAEPPTELDDVDAPPPTRIDQALHEAGLFRASVTCTVCNDDGARNVRKVGPALLVEGCPNCGKELLAC